ncbi:MAG: hypothetical protein AB1589_05820 [Cyanobacteriota bacterium]
MTIIFSISHRPNQLGGFDNHALTLLTNFAYEALTQYQPSKVISDLTLGWNIALAQVALELQIPLIVAIPCCNQSNPWSGPFPQLYSSILSRADFIVQQNIPWSKSAVTQFTFRVIDHCDLILAIWSDSIASYSEPIQRDCIHYAHSVGKPIVYLWDDWNRFCRP